MPALPHDPIQARSTKIVATIGNVSSDPAQLRQLHDAGVNVFRLNFSHGTQADQGARIDAIRAMEADTGMPTCILVDLQGPKFRVGLVEDGIVVKVYFDNDAVFNQPNAKFWPLQIYQNTCGHAGIRFHGAYGINPRPLVGLCAMRKIQPKNVDTSIV